MRDRNFIAKLVYLFLIFLISQNIFATEQKSINFKNGLEILVFQVSPNKLNDVIKIEDELWTKFLKKYPFFRAKRVGINPDKPGYFYIVIDWDSYKKWKSIPEIDIDEFSKYADKIFLNKTGRKVKLVEAISLKTMLIYNRK